MNFKFGRLYISEEVTDFSNIALPLIRRVFSQTIAQDLVTIQPLEARVGRLFYLDIDYGTRKKESILKTFKFGR